MAKKVKAKEDKVISTSPTPISDKILDEDQEYVFEDASEDGLVMSGKLGVGAEGHPVTITVTDEVTGAEIEMNHVHNALLVIEDKRKSSSGWLSLVIGDIRKVGDILHIVAQATMEELKKILKN